ANARLPPDVAVAALALAVECGPDAAAGADPAAGLGAGVGLRIRLLGASDDRRPADRDGAAADDDGRLRDPGAPHRRATRTARPRPRAPFLRAPPAAAAATEGARHRRALDRRAAGGGRVVGRHSAAVGVV